MGEKRYQILYEDDSIIVLNKPSGTLVIPTPKKETNTLTDRLNKELDGRGAGANAYPCHRLDRDTSGLIVYAKGKKAQQSMMDEFKNHRVKKLYTAFAHGDLKKNSDTIRDLIYNRNRRRNEPAITRYRVIERRDGYTVIEVEPVTGRTNQIRIHMAGIGHPLVGEDIFAFRRDFALRFKRVALHAARIEFTHPVTGKSLRFDASLPEDMAKFLTGEGTI